MLTGTPKSRYRMHVFVSKILKKPLFREVSLDSSISASALSDRRVISKRDRGHRTASDLHGGKRRVTGRSAAHPIRLGNLFGFLVFAEQLAPRLEVYMPASSPVQTLGAKSQTYQEGL